MSGINRRDFLKSSLILLGIVPTDEISKTEMDWDRISEIIDKFNIKFRGRSISNHPCLTEYSEITYSLDRLKFEVASEFGMIPSEFSALHISDKEEMYAYYISKKQIEAVMIWEEQEKLKRTKRIIKRQ